MPEVVFSVDQSKPMRDQAVPGHNRWHPDIPPAASVAPGSEFRVECREWTDAQLGNNDSANDVRDVNLSVCHMLSGPIEIQGAEPGDLLVVDILDLGPVQPPQERGDAPGQGWGYTGVFAKINGGGNHDIKNFTRGSRVYYPVHVPGAKFSGGDLHFSQGDGEITFCGAIEMGGFIDFGVDLIKDGMNKYAVTTNPVLIPGRVEPRYSEFLTFIGISVDESSGENYYLDATVAYRRACLNAIEYLKKFGYSGEQAYLLLGSAPIEGRISGVVD